MACRCGATPRTVKALSSLFQQIVRGGAQALGRLGAFPHAQPAPQLLQRRIAVRVQHGSLRSERGYVGRGSRIRGTDELGWRWSVGSCGRTLLLPPRFAALARPLPQPGGVRGLSATLGSRFRRNDERGAGMAGGGDGDSCGRTLLLPRAFLLRPPEIGSRVALVTFAGCANELPSLPFIQQP